MTLKTEIYNDIVANCDVLLERLKDAEVTNDTPEGRMIYQCRWLKEQVLADSLPLPVEDYIHTLRHVYTEYNLMHLASSETSYWEEIQIYIHRLIKLTKGVPLIKPIYYPYAIRCIEALLTLLRTASRPLDQYEQGLILELIQLKQLVQDSKVELPLENYLPDYPNFNKIDGLVKYAPKKYNMAASSKDLIKTTANLLFEGVRPNTWLTPETADRETANI